MRRRALLVQNNFKNMFDLPLTTIKPNMCIGFEVITEKHGLYFSNLRSCWLCAALNPNGRHKAREQSLHLTLFNDCGLLISRSHYHNNPMVVDSHKADETMLSSGYRKSGISSCDTQFMVKVLFKPLKPYCHHLLIPSTHQVQSELSEGYFQCEKVH